MIDKEPKPSSATQQPKPKPHWLWPALATAIAYPLFMALSLAFFLWLFHLFNPPFWLASSVILLLPILGLYATWRLMSAWARRNFQFSLRGMLAAMTVIAIVTGTAGNIFLQRMAVMEVAANGAYPEDWMIKEKNWLHANLRYDPFDKVQSLSVRSDQAIPFLLHHSEAFAELELLSFGTGSTDAALQNATEFNKFPKLTSGAFYRASPSDKGMEQLGDWTQVESLFFNGSSFTDKGLAHLVNLPKLKILTLIGDEGLGMTISDKGLTHIGKLSHLKFLSLTGLPITDSGLENLQNLADLEKLCIRRTNVTQDGLLKLAKALPDCWIIDDFTHFPLPFQIQKITVWKDSPHKQQLLTISDLAQIAAIMEFLERLLEQFQGGWQREWESKSAENISLDFESPNRRLFQVSFENNFYYGDWEARHPLSPSDAKELRRLLGLPQ